MTVRSLPSGRAFPIGLILIAMVSVQIGASAAKGLFPKVGAEGAAALRLMIFCPIMLAIWRPWRLTLGRSNLTPLLGYGVALGAMNLCFYLALRTIPLGVAVAIEFTGPLAVAVLHSRRWIDAVWIVLAVLGLMLLLPLGRLSTPMDLTGVVFALVAGIFWGLYIVFGQKVGSTIGGAAAAIGGVIAALVAAPFGIAHAGMALLDPHIWPVALVVALMSSVIPYSFEMVGLTRLSPRIFGILMSLEPAVAALSGLIFLHERLTALQILAILLVITASLGTVATSPREHGELDPPTLI